MPTGTYAVPKPRKLRTLGENKMGRPLNSRYFGPTKKDGVDLELEENISVIVKVGTNAVSEEGILLSQRSETRFRVNDAADNTGNAGVCTLVDKAVPDDDEMVIMGYVNGTDEQVAIRKVHNRTMIDFDNNRYTWEIQDDSTVNVLVLFEI